MHCAVLLVSLTLFLGLIQSLTLAQVLTTRQWASIIVHAYPYLMTVESSLEAFASHRGMQPKSVILKAAQTDDMESDWLALQEYTELISQEKSHDYLPLSKCSAFKFKVKT